MYCDAWISPGREIEAICRQVGGGVYKPNGQNITFDLFQNHDWLKLKLPKYSHDHYSDNKR